MRKYIYRNLPCTIHEDENLLWCVCGNDRINGGSGVLEWCYDAADAKAVFKKMQQSYEFTHLDYRKWKTRTLDAKQPVVTHFTSGDRVIYKEWKGSTHEIKAEVVTVNKYGHVTLRLSGGSIIGVKPENTDRVQKLI